MWVRVWHGELGLSGVRDMQRLCVLKAGPGRGGDTGVMVTLVVDELVSMEWSDVQDDDSESCDKRKGRSHRVAHSGGRQ